MTPSSGECRRPSLTACVPNERLGTLAGVKEADGRVRMVPTSHLGNDALRSFSYRIASVLTGGKPLPDVGLTQFVAPAGADCYAVEHA